MEIKFYASDRGFGRYMELLDRLNVLVNPQLFYDAPNMPEVERQAAIQQVKDELEELSH